MNQRRALLFSMNRIIFADRDSLTPNENDQQIKQFWIDAYKKSFNQGAVQSDGTIRSFICASKCMVSFERRMKQC